MGVEVTRPAGPMKFAPKETGKKERIAFLEGLDGHRVYFIQTVKWYAASARPICLIIVNLLDTIPSARLAWVGYMRTCPK